MTDRYYIISEQYEVDHKIWVLRDHEHSADRKLLWLELCSDEVIDVEHGVITVIKQRTTNTDTNHRLMLIALATRTLTVHTD